MANEKRLDLIDRNALMDSHWWNGMKDPFDKARAKIIIQSAKTVDAVEVVRCKDCKYHHYICLSGFLDRKDDDFCSYGKRRTE